MSILEVKNLSKSFGSTEVLKDISFTLEKGDVLSIIGQRQDDHPALHQPA